VSSRDPEPDDGAALEFPAANIAPVRAVAAALEPTLGPRCRDKLIVTDQRSEAETQPGMPATNEFVVTSDGATILEHLPVAHPIAPILYRMVGPERPGDTDVEGERRPDGITTRAVLAGALLREAESLLELGLHPRSVVQGYGRAREVAHEAVLDVRRRVETFDDPRAARVATARTAMTGNDVAGLGDSWATLAVEAVDFVGRPNEETFVVRRVSDGSITDSRLVRGAVLDRSGRAHDAMPRQVTDATVLVLDGHERGGLQERDAPSGATVSLSSPDDVADYEAVRADRKRQLVDGLSAAGVDVVVTRLGIDRAYQRLLADAGIVGIRSVTPLDLAQVALATGARRVMDPTDVTPADLGAAGTVREVRIEPYAGRRKRRRMVVFDDCRDPASVAVLLRGVSGQLADQATTAVRKAAFAVALADGLPGRPAGVVPGGGAVHVHVAGAVRAAAREVGSREQLAMKGFADAVESLPATLARNAGLDPISVVSELREAHRNGRETAGLVFPRTTVEDALAAGVLDPAALVDAAYRDATDVASLVLRVDDTLDANPPPEPPDPGEAHYEEPAERHRESVDR
jgi:chaperonin GroEL (HSP60 family)